jgi:hypothetical protein
MIKGNFWIRVERLRRHYPRRYIAVTLREEYHWTFVSIGKVLGGISGWAANRHYRLGMGYIVGDYRFEYYYLPVPKPGLLPKR